jgi:hypothetical protein
MLVEESRQRLFPNIPPFWVAHNIMLSFFFPKLLFVTDERFDLSLSLRISLAQVAGFVG